MCSTIAFDIYESQLNIATVNSTCHTASMKIQQLIKQTASSFYKVSHGCDYELGLDSLYDQVKDFQPFFFSHFITWKTME